MFPQWLHRQHWLACIGHPLGRGLLSVSMVGSYRVRIHAHAGSCFVVWAVVEVVVDLLGGVGLPGGDFAKVAVSEQSPVCPCQTEAV